VKLVRTPHLGSAAESGFPQPSHEKLTLACGWRPEIPLDVTLKGLIEYWKRR